MYRKLTIIARTQIQHHFQARIIYDFSFPLLMFLYSLAEVPGLRTALSRHRVIEPESHKIDF